MKLLLDLGSADAKRVDFFFFLNHSDVIILL